MARTSKTEDGPWPIKMHPAHKLLKHATKDNGRILAIGPDDNLVELPPGSVKVGFDQDTGDVAFHGLKDGFRIATQDDIDRKEIAELERKEREAQAKRVETNADAE